MKIDKVIRTYPHDPDHPGSLLLLIVIVYCYCLFLLFTERVKRMKQIEVDWDEKKKSLEDELVRIQTLLASTYDK